MNSDDMFYTKNVFREIDQDFFLHLFVDGSPNLHLYVLQVFKYHPFSRY